MCGIVGIADLTGSSPIEQSQLRQMLALLRHRGPDQAGIYLDALVGLGSARLNIIDLNTGQQPICNEDGTLWIVFNGEIYNYIELRAELVKQGHRFSTETDTEVILHLFEDLGPDCLAHLNGQFAFAIWNTSARTLFLARDRLGVRPLFYTTVDGSLLFASEIKAILADRRVRAELDVTALGQIFTFWSPLSPRTAFRGIVELKPGHYMWVSREGNTIEPYWQLDFPAASDEDASYAARGDGRLSVEAQIDEYRDLLVDATLLRLRADVPVGAYLSGGLDSSTVTAIIRRYAGNRLDTFSIAFGDPAFDESEHQLRMARFLGTDHHVVFATWADIGRVFPDVIWHTEVPIVRTAPAPLFLLSGLVREHHLKVVLTGEGADEFMAGYDIFKEDKIRRFWARQPKSALRPRLLRRLYPDISGLSSNSDAYLAAFFGQGLSDVETPYYSHAVRWGNNARTWRFFSDEVTQELRQQGGIPLAAVSYPPRFWDWDPLSRTQYLETVVFLSEYLLSSQGDRVAMAHSVEARFPFLDHRVVEFSNRLPADLKLRGLTDKYLLRRVASEWLPAEVWRRPKRPYRAPIARSFLDAGAPAYVRDLLSPQSIAESGVFKASSVSLLLQKFDRGLAVQETDEMALAGVISTQLLIQQFVKDFRMPPPLSAADDVKVCLGTRACERTPHEI